MEALFQRSKLEKMKLEWIYINHKGDLFNGWLEWSTFRMNM